MIPLSEFSLMTETLCPISDAFRISFATRLQINWHVAEVGYSLHPIAHLCAERSQLIVCLDDPGGDKNKQLRCEQGYYSYC
jgi:hypothetical protein